MQTATFTVRQATPDDRSAALRVCLLTGDEGYDASDQYVYDPDALGKRWVAPYLDLQPDLAFVLEDEDGLVCGYCLAALDSTEFAKRLQEEYLPPLQAIHPDHRSQDFQNKQRRIFFKQKRRYSWSFCVP